MSCNSKNLPVIIICNSGGGFLKGSFLKGVFIMVGLEYCIAPKVFSIAVTCMDIYKLLGLVLWSISNYIR